MIAPEGVRAFLGELLDAMPDLQLRDRLDDHAGRALRRAVAHQRHVRRARARSTASQPTGDRFAIEGIDLLTVKDGLIQSNDAFPDSIAVAAPARHDPAAGLARRAAPDRRVQRQDAPDLAAVRQRGAAGRHRRVGRAGPARALQRLPDRGRGRRDDVRRRRAHDDARARARRRQARRHPPHRARPRPHRPPRRRAGHRRARLLPPRRGAGRRRQRRLSLLARGPRRPARSRSARCTG